MDLTFANESSLHRETKNLIAKMAAANGGRFLVSTDLGSRYQTVGLDLRGSKVVIECDDTGEQVLNAEAYRAQRGYFPEMIFDVGFVADGRVIAAIEVIRSSGINSRKRAKIIAAGVLCLAVKANHNEWYIDDRRIEAVTVIAPPNARVHLSAAPLRQAAAS